ncbi:hypothetical protein SM124_15280 [Bacillus sp. 31A1R]|uniref:Uncharacterized protein n=1 Tax=Robertmurraya mangrovi TaxID=3098077 RepID=A0ABU5J141_9BACI|nr:hypothetical protein [Bacillus sp. 31A1R]MDZ5473080.1 hypothetical protein [Bacillus sp. 31A1R]
MNEKIKTYDEAVKVVQDIGLLPLAPLVPGYPSLNSITSPESWHSETEFDPWIWRTKFSVDGVAGYGKFIKKKSVLISRELLPYVKKVIGSELSVESRYQSGNMSKVAVEMYNIVKETEGIDTRLLRTKAGLRDKEHKKIFENALLELQGSMDLVISGIKEKINEDGEKNDWNSTSFETYDSWADRNEIMVVDISREDARIYLLEHFSKFSSQETLKKFQKIF